MDSDSGIKEFKLVVCKLQWFENQLKEQSHCDPERKGVTSPFSYTVSRGTGNRNLF